jgi:hypothetical protein
MSGRNRIARFTEGFIDNLIGVKIDLPIVIITAIGTHR